MLYLDFMPTTENGQHIETVGFIGCA